MGWANLIPNPLVVGGAGVSGEILVYDPGGVLLASINSAGVTFYDVAGNPVTVQDDTGLSIYDAVGTTLISLSPTGLQVNTAAGVSLATVDASGITFYDGAGNPASIQDDTGIYIYDAAGNPVGLLADFGLQVISPANGTNLLVSPSGGSGNPQILFTTVNSPLNEWSAIYALDFTAPQDGAGLELTTTEYTQTILGGTVRQVVRIGPDWSEIFVVGAGGTHHGGAAGVDDEQGRVYAAPSNVIVAEVTANVAGTVDVWGTDYVWIDGWNDVWIDGPVTLDSVLTCAPAAGSSSKQIEFNHSYAIYADNAGTGAAGTRLWIDSVDNGQIVIGPRAGGSYLHDFRIRTDATTASAANCFIDSTTQQIKRSTSSIRYKTDVTDAVFDPAALLGLRPVRFHDRAQLGELGDTAPWHVGFIAEELDDLGLGDFVYHDSATGRAESVQYDRLTAGLIYLIKDLYDRVRYLERGQAA